LGLGLEAEVEQWLMDFFETGKVKLVAFCDVDDVRATNTYKTRPIVTKCRDFRKIYDNHLKDFDAIAVATSDHTHVVISLPFMNAKNR
jgi:predicted dehydrogenase